MFWAAPGEGKPLQEGRGSELLWVSLLEFLLNLELHPEFRLTRKLSFRILRKCWK